MLAKKLEMYYLSLVGFHMLVKQLGVLLSSGCVHILVEDVGSRTFLVVFTCLYEVWSTIICLWLAARACEEVGSVSFVSGWCSQCHACEEVGSTITRL